LNRGRVRVVLVRPETPANIGAVARIVSNTDLDGVDLVAPGDWRTIECWRTAWGAPDVLEQTRVHARLQDALAGVNLAVAFTGRRDRDAAFGDVRDAAQQVAALAPDEGAALVFGPETAGLTRAEMALCGVRASIPASPRQPSLNLSHAVMVAAYEVYRAAAPRTARPGRATHAQKQAMLALLREGMLHLGALQPATADRYFMDWTNLFQRADLTPKEIRMLEHLARQLKRRGKRA
jgi:TrmH family RNA methyltransferase